MKGTRREQMHIEEMAQILNEVRTILKEEDKGIVNVTRLLDRLQTVTNYKGA